MKDIHMPVGFGNRIRVKNRTFIQWIVMVVALWSVLMKPISGLPGALTYLKYAPDGILLVMLFLVFRRQQIMLRRDLLPLLLIVVGFFIYCLLGNILQYQSAAYFLWGFRNNFRFYIAFFAFITYLDEDDVSTWFRVIEILFWVNAALSVIQFVLLGIGGDFLGGIFGIVGASNGYTLVFLSIVVGKALLEAFDGSRPFWGCMIKCMVSIAVAAMAELKFYFVVVVLLMIGATVLTRFSVRKLIFLLLGAGALMTGAVLLAEWFGSHNFLSLNKIWEFATKESYASEGDINRLSAVSSLSEQILTKPVQQLFGLGLGNCDTSAFAVCNTPFYRKNSYLHYTWFTSAMIFLETGYCGLSIYSGFFVANFGQSYKRFVSRNGNQLYNRLAILTAVLCLILLVYDSSTRTEPGYMMYFVLATPFICSKAVEKHSSQTSDTGGEM